MHTIESTRQTLKNANISLFFYFLLQYFNIFLSKIFEKDKLTLNNFKSCMQRGDSKNKRKKKTNIYVRKNKNV